MYDMVKNNLQFIYNNWVALTQFGIVSEILGREKVYL